MSNFIKFLSNGTNVTTLKPKNFCSPRSNHGFSITSSTFSNLTPKSPS